MTNLTRLWTGLEQSADTLRYGTGRGSVTAASERKPVVVWNITRTCNLHCTHCYSDSDTLLYRGEVGLSGAERILDDLAAYGVKHLLLSGGEPTLHPEFHAIAAAARDRGLRLTLSTNGTRLTQDRVKMLRDLDFSYVGISLDGIGAAHDAFRGKRGAFDRTLQGLRHCREAGQKVGLRLTLTQTTIEQLGSILDLVEQEDIPRVCFYHLVPSGRGQALSLPSALELQMALDLMLERVERWQRAGAERELLTVAQPADGAYLLWRLEHEHSPHLSEARKLLRWNGGAQHGSGTGIANIDPIGNVHPDQFSQNITYGNVHKTPFSQIWEKAKTSPSAQSSGSTPTVRGRCRNCRYLDVCGGGFRARALRMTGRANASDPACYLQDTMIAPPRARRGPRSILFHKRRMWTLAHWE
jgi:radical SAM protein with 4Fe4S-binding SPASM domain